MLVNGRTLMSLRAYWEEQCASGAQAFRNALASESQETISAITETFEQAATHLAAVRAAQAQYNTTVAVETRNEPRLGPSPSIFAALVFVEYLERLARLWRAAMHWDTAAFDRLLSADRARDYGARIASLRAAIDRANHTTLDLELPASVVVS